MQHHGSTRNLGPDDRTMTVRVFGRNRMDVRNPLQSALKDNRPYALQKALKSLGQEDSVTLFNTLEMLQRNEAIVLDERHFTVGVSSCGRSELWQHACWLFEAMPKANIQPDVISFTAAVSACEKAGEWQHALSYIAAIKLQVFSQTW